MGTGGERYGAGRPGNRAKAESSKRFDVREIRRKGLLRTGAAFNWQWSIDGRPCGTVAVRVHPDSLRIEYAIQQEDGPKDRSQSVPLVQTACQFGGHRTWFSCPCCARRVEVLYLRWQRFACRTCQRISYRSQSGSVCDRTCNRFHRLDAIVQEGKPKWQRWSTFNRLLDRWERADEAMNLQLGLQLRKLGISWP